MLVKYIPLVLQSREGIGNFARLNQLLRETSACRITLLHFPSWRRSALDVGTDSFWSVTVSPILIFTEELFETSYFPDSLPRYGNVARLSSIQVRPASVWSSCFSAFGVISSPLFTVRSSCTLIASGLVIVAVIVASPALVTALR